MRNLIACTTVAVLLASPALAMQIGSDKYDGDKVFTGNVQIRFDPNEKFEITADKTTQSGDTSEYLGNVMVTFMGSVYEADKMSSTKQNDGGYLLTTQKLTSVKD